MLGEYTCLNINTVQIINIHMCTYMYIYVCTYILDIIRNMAAIASMAYVAGVSLYVV